MSVYILVLHDGRTVHIEAESICFFGPGVAFYAADGHLIVAYAGGEWRTVTRREG